MGSVVQLPFHIRRLLSHSVLVAALISSLLAGPLLPGQTFAAGAPRAPKPNPHTSTGQSGRQITGAPGASDRSSTTTFTNQPYKQIPSPPHQDTPGPESGLRNKPLPADAFIQREENRASPGIPSLAPSPAPSNGFQAVADDNTYVSPDTQGAVGPGHLMSTLNSQISIQNKVGAIVSTTSLTGFWSSLGYASLFDPRVLYDRHSNRWILIALADHRSATSALLVGVSRTGDPADTWQSTGRMLTPQTRTSQIIRPLASIRIGSSSR